MNGEELAETQSKVMVQSIKKIRSNTLFQNVLILCILEANMGISHSNLKQDVRNAKLPLVEFMVERKGPEKSNTVGVIKGPKHAEIYTHMLVSMLKLGYLTIYNKFMCLDPPYCEKGEDVIDVLGQMMLNLHPDEKNHNRPTAKTADLSDDCLVAFMMNLYWPCFFWNDPKYRNFRSLLPQQMHRYRFPGLIFERT
jgi:hypothetical protein